MLQFLKQIKGGKVLREGRPLPYTLRRFKHIFCEDKKAPSDEGAVETAGFDWGRDFSFLSFRHGYAAPPSSSEEGKITMRLLNFLFLREGAETLPYALRRFQHIFCENAVAFCGVVYKNVGYGAD